MAYLFVVVGEDTSDNGPAAYTSPNGYAWTERSVPGTEELVTVIAGGPRFIAPLASSISGDNAALSLDAETWTLDAITSGINFESPATYGGDRYVAVNGTTSYTSTDGITWTTHSSVLPNSDWRAIAYGNGVFVVVGSSNGGNSIAYSSDGETWSEYSTTIGWGTVAYGGGRFVASRAGAVSQEGDAKTDHTITSTNGATWTARDSYGGQWLQSAHSNAGFVVLGVGRDNAETPPLFAIRMSSQDGVTWSYSREQALDTPNVIRRELAGAGWTFVYAPGGNEIWFSNNGTSWSSAGTFADRAWGGVAYYLQQSDNETFHHKFLNQRRRRA